MTASRQQPVVHRLDRHAVVASAGGYLGRRPAPGPFLSIRKEINGMTVPVGTFY